MQQSFKAPPALAWNCEAFDSMPVRSEKFKVFHNIPDAPWWFSFFLSILQSVMADYNGRCGCGTKFLKKRRKKITIQIFDNATSVKTIYKQSSGIGMPSHVPAQPYVIIFWT